MDMQQLGYFIFMEQSDQEDQAQEQADQGDQTQEQEDQS